MREEKKRKMGMKRKEHDVTDLMDRRAGCNGQMYVTDMADERGRRVMDVKKKNRQT